MQKSVILFYGSPGAGKSTQAEKVAAKYKFSYFDSGKYIEKLVHDEKLLKKSAVIRRQRKLFISGKLTDPAWAGAEAKKRIKEMSSKGKSLVMCGSPRTMKETFKLKGGGVADTLIKNYGLSNILVIFLSIPVAESIKRNSKRGRAELDEPMIIRERCREYAKRTLPVIKEMRKIGIKIVKIDGVPSRVKVERSVRKAIKEFFECQESNLKKTCRRLKFRGVS